MPVKNLSRLTQSWFNGEITGLNDKEKEIIKKSGIIEQVSVVTIEAIPTATAGILTNEQLQVLQENDSNYIMFNHEKFYLSDKGHTEGFLTYSHLGYENNNMYAKTITITVNTKSWVLKPIAVQPYNFDSIGSGLRVEDGVLKSNVTFTQDDTTLNITLLED